MSALLNQLSSFIQWIYDSVNSVLTFVTACIQWLHDEMIIIMTVSNVVLPPTFQALLVFLIGFMLVCLVVRLVVNLL